MRSTELRSAAARVAVIRSLGLLVFFALAARAAHLTVIDDQGQELWGRQVHSRLELPAARGVVYDRRGTELAISVNSPSVYAIAAELDDAARNALANALGVARSAIDSRVAQRRGFTYIARWVTPAQAAAVAKLGLRGVGLVAEPRRAYPAGALAGRIIGFTNIDGVGARGIEQREDEWLAGTPLVVPVERDGGGELLALSPMRPTDAAGGDIALTLDASLQAEAENALFAAVKETDSRGGTIVTLDPRTGDILTLAEAPGFDPNRFRVTPYRETGAPAFDMMVEPGSTMKVFLAAAALEAGAIRLEDVLDTLGGELEVPGKTIKDRRDFGPLDLAGMLRVSSNVAAVLVAQRLGPQAHYAALRRFGFGGSTGSAFPSESAGLLRPWSEWKPVDHATIAYGQGVSATPIQLAAATAALANEGVWRTPRLVLARRAPEGDWEYAPLGASHRAVRPETARQVLAMMRDVVSAEGTGRLAGLAGLDVAGKTGTAQKLDPVTHAYSKDRYIAWFIGAVPAAAPRLVVAVALDEPKRVHSGGLVAAPVFARVAAAQLAHLGIITRPEPMAAPVAPSVLLAEADAVRARSAHVSAPAPVAAAPPLALLPAREPLAIARIGDRVLVPDFRGHSLSEVRQITAAHALGLDASGTGHAVEQDPAPGTILASSDRRVRVRFSDVHAKQIPAADGGEG